MRLNRCENAGTGWGGILRVRKKDKSRGRAGLMLSDKSCLPLTSLMPPRLKAGRCQFTEEKECKKTLRTKNKFLLWCLSYWDVIRVFSLIFICWFESVICISMIITLSARYANITERKKTKLNSDVSFVWIILYTKPLKSLL